jgi:hypothetical protein
MAGGRFLRNAKILLAVNAALVEPWELGGQVRTGQAR